MTYYTKWMLGLVVLMLAVSFIVIWNIQDRYFETEELTIQEATSQIETLYSGKVGSFEQKGEVFYLSLERNESTYEIHVDSETGNIISFHKTSNENPDTIDIKTEEEIRTLLTSQNKGTIKTINLHQNGPTPQYLVEMIENETLKTLVVHAKSGEILSEKAKVQTPIEPATAISSDKAKQIALSQLNGTVQYVAFEQSSDGGYYLVEVSTADQKAVFEIHAITGKVKSVTRNHYASDDDDDDDEMDEDEEDDEDEEE